MRYLINWIRQCFCKHEFKYEEKYVEAKGATELETTTGLKISRTCTKCGWHTNYWKFL